MKRWTSFAFAVAALAAARSEAATFTYDFNNQGWESSWVGYNGGSFEQLYPNTPADWTGAYGVGFPDGSIYQSSNGSSWEKRPYWVGIRNQAPGALFGDLTGKTLQAFIRSTANWISRVATDTVYLRWTIGDENDPNGKSNIWVSRAAYSINLNDPSFGSGSDLDWVLHSIQMDPSRFFQWPNNSNGGTFASVLQNYTSVGFAILPTPAGDDDLDYFNGAAPTWGPGSTLLHYGATSANGQTATFGVDSLGVAVPGPAAVLPFAVGLLGALARRKRA